MCSAKLELAPNELIAYRWRVRRLVAKGGFSSVYQVQDSRTKGLCALKVEMVGDVRKKSETVTKMEAAILIRLRGVSKHVCAFLGCGRVKGRLHYVVMSLVGPNFDDLRRSRPGGRMESGTVARMAIQCLHSIRDLHQVGFLHRDVKPGNFAVGRPGNNDYRNVYLLDFGLARRYRKEGCVDIRPKRESVGFRGTQRYCSMNAHYSADLGRHDDLWSLFFVLIEMSAGRLPWQMIEDSITVGRMKRTVEMDELVDKKDMDMFRPINDELKKLRYEQQPNYESFVQHFVRLQRKYKYAVDGPFEWEKDDDDEETVTAESERSTATAKDDKSE